MSVYRKGKRFGALLLAVSLAAFGTGAVHAENEGAGAEDSNVTLLPAPADGGSGAAPANPGPDRPAGPAAGGGTSGHPGAGVSDGVVAVPEPTGPDAMAEPIGPALDPDRPVRSEAGVAGGTEGDGAQAGGAAADGAQASDSAGTPGDAQAMEKATTTATAEPVSQGPSRLATPAFYVAAGLVLLIAIVALALGRKRRAAKK